MLCDNIRNYRKKINLSQDELAERLNVTRQSISLWENGQTQPSLDNIVALASIFGITTDELLGAVPCSESEPKPPVVTPEGERPAVPSGNEKGNASTVVAFIMIGLAVVAIVVAIVLIIGELSDRSATLTGLFSRGDTVSTESEDVLSEVTGEQSQEEEPAAPGEQVTSKKQTASKQPTASQKTGTVSKADEPKKKDMSKLYSYLKDFVIKNGVVDGERSHYSRLSSNYGGYDTETFALTYWANIDRLDFSLCANLDSTYSVCFYLTVPKNYTGKYHYISSYFYTTNGIAVYETEGTIDAAEFSTSYPLNSESYIGPSDSKANFMEMSRVGMCDLLKCLKNFITEENIDYSFADMGFVKF